VNNKILTVLQVIRPEANFESSEDFVEDALIDSLDIVVLVNEIEALFGVKIPGELVIAENFRSVRAIAELVKSLQ
jgi:acyl carrier protein